MARAELKEASEKLELAADGVSDAEIRDELTTLADHMQQLATRERGPDHGRMARHDRAMLHLIDETDGAVKDHIETALDRLRAYRSTVEGV